MIESLLPKHVYSLRGARSIRIALLAGIGGIETS